MTPPGQGIGARIWRGPGIGDRRCGLRRRLRAQGRSLGGISDPTVLDPDTQTESCCPFLPSYRHLLTTQDGGARRTSLDADMPAVAST